MQYIDGLKPKERFYLSFGSTIHACAQFFYRALLPAPPTLDELLGFYEKNWRRAGYESVEDEAAYKNYGTKIITRFWEIHSPEYLHPVAVEKAFTIDVDGVKLRGFIDRVDKLPDGRLAVLDYKTNKELFSVADIENDLQLTFYQMAAEELWQIPVANLTLYHFRSNTPVSCGPRSQAQITEARELVTTVARGIAAADFPAREHAFCPCDFERYCPFHRHKFIGSSQQDAQTGVAIPQAVERYASLQEQIKEMQAELEGLKEMLVACCREQDLRRVYGTEHAVTYSMVARSGYVEEEIKSFLSSAGLWERALRFDPARVNKLLQDEDAAEDIKRQIEAQKSVLSRYPQLRVKNITDGHDEEGTAV